LTYASSEEHGYSVNQVSGEFGLCVMCESYTVQRTTHTQHTTCCHSTTL